MVAVCELIGLYSDVNQEVIDRNLHTISPYYRAVTRQLKEVKEKLMAIPLSMPQDTTASKVENERFKNIWNFYRKDLVEDASNP